jgi:hypothetical protein
MRYLFANNPKLAARWEDTYGIPKKLPQHVKKKKVKRKTKKRK